MARISTYALDENLVASDKWIGTSANDSNATKNYSLGNVTDYLNKSGVIDSQTLRYKYQDVTPQDVRETATISFATSQGSTVNFSSITTWVLSKFAKPGKEVDSFYTSPLIGSYVLVTNAANVSNWAVYLWTGSVATTDPNFYNIGLTYISGSGFLQKNKDYLISLLTYDVAGQTGDKNFLFTQNNPLATWVVNHNLDKYPSASVVTGVNDELIYGNVTYQSTNKLTITFSSPVSGKAFIN
jgi:hypothetical protein|tara:strand:+ start:1694 stop:2416 length:723 start_codon:yes stop_codon:yes gene_type:complete